MRSRKVGIIIGSLICVVILFTAGFFAWRHLSTSSLFHQPGEIIYNDGLSEAQYEFLTTILNVDDIPALSHDVRISSQTTAYLEANDSRLLYNILVPTTDFYSSISDISSDELAKYQLTPILELTPQQKLLALDGSYYLDSFNAGAVFEYLAFEGEPEDVVKITTLIQKRLPELPTTDTILTFAQTGVTALARRMNAKLSQTGDAAYFAANIGPFLSQFDLTHTSNESSFSNLATASNICSNPQMIDTLLAIGLDIVELTGNHNQDCGDQAALDTLNIYAEHGIQTVGGNATAELAATPLQINQKDTQITMLAYNLSTGGYTLDDTPGANFYTTAKASTDIAAAKERGDLVIVDVQYYECNDYDNTVDRRTCDYANSAAGDQIGLFREIAGLGADIIVGTAAHQPQTYELYGESMIYYGLGNLFFDQSWWPGTTRNLILVHYFYQNQLLQTRIVPTIYDDSLQTRLMDSNAANAFIERLLQARPIT